MQATRRSGVLLGVVVILLALLSGCGYKTDPVPPGEVMPEPVTDLRYQLSERGVTLTWSYPTRTVTGDRLEQIDSFAIYRAVVPAKDYCDTCPIPFGQPILVPGGTVPVEGTRTGRFESTLLRPGHLYFFKVRARSGWWAESDDSNIVSFLWHIPLKAPTGLRARAEDSRIVLAWQPVVSHLDSSPVTGPVQYQVYRSTDGGTFEPLDGPVQATRFVDTAVVNGRKYFYHVQALERFERGIVGGGTSADVAVSPVDRTPPAPPTGVRAIRTGKGIKVFWEPVPDRDLRGYRVYRRLSGDRAPELVGEVNAPYTMFIDRTALHRGQRLYYSVSSIDGARPANESISSPEVMIRN
ncbi:fibronectin type III domain-containing protein [Desulfolithobacter sp.]